MPEKQGEFYDLEAVTKAATEIFGDRVHAWLSKPSRHLAGLSPAEMAQTSPGARIVLTELRRNGPLT